MKKKILFSVVLIMLCMAAFAFGGGFGAQKPVGTLHTSDSNRFVVFTSKAQLDQHLASHEGDLFTLSTGERGKYDDKFFQTQALVMFITDGMSGSIKVQCEGYELKGNELHVTVKELSPAIHTMDLRYNTLTVAVPQEIATSIDKVVLNSYRVEI